MVALRHSNRLRQQAAGVKKHKREAKTKESGHYSRVSRVSRSEEYAKLNPTARLLWNVCLVWSAQKLLEMRLQYFRFWWLVVFHGRSLDRIIQVLERVRRTKLRMDERVKLGLPRPRLQRHWGRNYHHMIPRSRGGRAKAQNLMLIRLDRHVGWHILFKDERNRDMTLDEVIAMLISWRQVPQMSLAK